MRFSDALRIIVAVAIVYALVFETAAQSKRNSRRDAPAEKANGRKSMAQKPAATTAEKKADGEKGVAEDAAAAVGSSGEPQDGDEVVRVETDLVTVPVIVSDQDNRYIPDMRREEFSVSEDGVEQKVVFFATVNEPFNVVLMLDTSASTQEQLGRIQRAAISFVGQLQPADRIKVISFDNEVRELIEFSNDRAALGAAIRYTRPGRGTKLYDAMSVALGSLSQLQKKRRAIVIFTDGVDWHSDEARYEDALRVIDEAGIIVYPVRYDTRLDTELIARRQAAGAPTVDPGILTGGTISTSRSTTPTTFPGGQIPQLPDTRTSIPLPLPTPGRRAETDPRTTGGRGGGGEPTIGGPFPDGRDRDPRAPFPGRRDDSTSTSSPSTRRSPQRGGDGITAMLDLAYQRADDYLNELALKSGGKVYRADTLVSLPAAFAQIAAELRTQYALGYYPQRRVRDGKFRKIQVRTTRRDAIVRSRPGYRTLKDENEM